MHLSIIVPAYNEEKNLENSIKNFFDYLKNQNYDFEVIIVNDGSTDRTIEIAKELKDKYNNLRIIDNDTNRGKGAVVRQGFLEATGKYRLFIDADNATTINHLDLVWPHFENGADIVIGSRNHRDATSAYQKTKQPAWKRFFGMCGNYFIQLLTVRGIWDTQCGFKIITDEASKKIIPKLKCKRWAFDVEILLLMEKAGYKIKIIPVEWNNSENSRVGVKGYFITLIEIIKIKYNSILKKY